MSSQSLVECLQCGNVFPAASVHCSYCGHRNQAGMGSVGKAWHWLKDAIGNPEINPRNLTALAADVENKITASSRQRERISKQFQGLCATLGFEKAVSDIRTAFLKAGGSHLNDLLKGEAFKAESGLTRFQTLTNPDYFFSSQDLKERLSDLEDLFLLLQKIMTQTPDYSIFHPRARFLGYLEDGLRVTRSILDDPPRLQQLDTVFKTLFQANEVLNRKIREYAMLRHAIRIEFWKAEGMKIRFSLSSRGKPKNDAGATIDKLISDGKRLSHLLNEECTGQTGEDPLNLQSVIQDQLNALEQWRLLTYSQQALGMVEEVKTLDGGYPDARRSAEALGTLGQQTLSDPAVILHATFERFQEEEIRLAGEGRVLSGSLPVLTGNSDQGEKAG